MPHSIQFNPNSSLLVTARGSTIWIWKKVTKKEWKLLAQMKHQGMISSAVLNLDSSLLQVASCNNAKVYRLYDPTKLNQLLNTDLKEIRSIVDNSDKD